MFRYACVMGQISFLIGSPRTTTGCPMPVLFTDGRQVKDLRYYSPENPLHWHTRAIKYMSTLNVNLTHGALEHQSHIEGINLTLSNSFSVRFIRLLYYQSKVIRLSDQPDYQVLRFISDLTRRARFTGRCSFIWSFVWMCVGLPHCSGLVRCLLVRCLQ